MDLGTVTRLRVEGPLSPADMLVAMRCACGICERQFTPGEHWAALPRGPMDEEEARKRDAGLDYRVACEPVHYDCILRRLLRVMNWYRQRGYA